ncbi:DUF4384 domain-containing protein [Candidatus Bipolaricaulota bacterium]|nr:DUF4384 domain-containing protein [Candidatus Bipolaricaulota bacterium]
MKTNSTRLLFTLALVTVFSLAVMGVHTWAAASQDQPSSAKGVIVEEVVPESQFNVTVSTDKTRYQIGETMHIQVRSDRSGYLTLYDIQPDGKVNVLYPNQFHPDQKIQAGKTYEIPAPSDSFRFRVQPPKGRDILWAVVSSEPGVFPLEKATEESPFPQVAKDAGEFAKNVKGVTVEQKKAWGAGYSVFYIGEPLGGHIHVDSIPSGASIWLNDAYRGKTPMTIYDLKPGQYEITLNKDGFQNWTTMVQVKSGITKNVSKQLIPVPKNPTINSLQVTPSPSTEGQQVSFSAQASVPGGGPLTYRWTIAGSQHTGKSVSLTFTDDRKVNWNLQVTSESGGVTSTSGTHVVKNVAPALASVDVTPSPSTEGQQVRFQAQATDSGQDSLTYAWTIAGTRYTGKSLSVTFDDNAQVSWSLQVTDGDGGAVTTSGAHSIKNVAPAIDSVSISPAPSVEGQNVKFSVRASDPGKDTLSYSWKIAGKQFTGPSVGLTFNDNRQVSWSLQVSDEDGGATNTSGIHQVQNVGPTIDSVAISPTPSTEGEKVTFTAKAQDPGRDSLSFSWNIAGTNYTGKRIGVTFNRRGKVSWSLQVADGEGGVATSSGTHVIQEKEPTTTNVYISIPDEGKVMKAIYGILGLRTVAQNLDNPYGIACSSEGVLYVAENGANRIVSLSQGGRQKTVVRTLSESPLNLTFGPGGDLFFTTDAGNIWRLGENKLEKLAPQKSLVKGVQPVEGGTFKEDKNPYDIAFIEKGKYAGDMIVSLATSFPHTGRVVRLPAPNYDRIVSFINSYQITESTGAVVTKELQTPTGLAASRKGDIFVASFARGERRILRYSATGQFLGVFTENISRPNGLEIDWHQRLYASTASYSEGEAVSGSLRRYSVSTGQQDLISQFGAWGIAICES